MVTCASLKLIFRSTARTPCQGSKRSAQRSMSRSTHRGTLLIRGLVRVVWLLDRKLSVSSRR